MKKLTAILLKSFLGLIILILVLLFTVPLIFREKIKTKVEAVINESVNAKVTFTDYKLTFFRNFPNLSFSLKDLYIAGTGQFEGDTLAGFKSFDLVFNLGSLFSKSGYEVKSVIIDKAVVNAIVLKDGTANWDISKPSGPEAPVTAAAVPESTGESTMKVLLRKVEIKNSSITYSDSTMDLEAVIIDMNFTLAGNMTLSETDLLMTLSSGQTTVSMEGIKYLNKVVIDSRIALLANMDSMKFTFGENYFGINDLKLNFSGMLAMPGDDISTNMTFGSSQTSFKTLLSLVPAVYMEGYENLKASGTFSLSGSAIGVYSDADSTMPDVRLKMSVTDGLISYPDLPEKLSAINIVSDMFVDGKDLDKTTVNIEKFHFELAGSPFDASFFIRTPMSDPDFKGSMKGKIDLGALTKAVPIDSMNLSGVLDMAISMAGKMSMIEKEQYDKFSMEGNLGVKDMVVEMIGYPGVKISDAEMQFTPAFLILKKAELIVAEKSDFSITGQLGNYIPYVLKDETLTGKLIVNSKVIDGSSLMDSMSSDSTSASTSSTPSTPSTSSTSSTSSTPPIDTALFAEIAVPKNFDLTINATALKFTYDNIIAESVKCQMIIKDGIFSIKDGAMNMIGGTIHMDADYDTRDILKPVMKADISMKNIPVKEAFTTFVMVQKLAPAAKGIEGKINAQLVYQSLIGSDFMPVINTIDGAGKIQSDQLQLMESQTFDKIKGVLKLGDKYSNTFKDVNLSFKIKEGRVYVSPFDIKLGNMKMNIAGDQGLDQTLNYLIKTEIPRSDLGSSVNSLIDNLSSQAALLGFSYKPSDVIKVNVKVSGTFNKPDVAPVFGGTASGGAGNVKGASDQVVKQVVSSAVDKTKEELRKEAEVQGDNLIREAEARGQQLRDEAAKGAQRIRQEADTSAAKLIKGAETKGMLARVGAQKGADALKKEADKRATQLVIEADNQAKKLVEEAKVRKEEMIKKI